LAGRSTEKSKARLGGSFSPGEKARLRASVESNYFPAKTNGYENTASARTPSDFLFSKHILLRKGKKSRRGHCEIAADVRRL
jgi:hypothetical protein